MGLASRTLIILAALLATAAQAHEAARQGDLDIEHIFGFTEGSDIGAKGEKLSFAPLLRNIEKLLGS